MSADRLHITLVFLGSRPASELDDIGRVTGDCAASARRAAFHARRYKETARVGMIQLQEDPVAGEHFTGRANMLAGHLMRELESRRMYRREHRGWTPHVTVARFRQPPGLTLEPPDLGSFSTPDVILFRSVPTPEGSTYERIGAWSVPV
jgi:2'-5' RNA ligase